LHDGFVLPFQRPGLAALYGGVIVGLFGMILLNVFLAFDLASMGMAELLIFLTVHLGSINLVCMPLGFMMLARMRAQTFLCLLVGVQVISLFVMASEAIMSSLVVMGLAYSFISAPFWLIYHSSMLHYSSQKNRGNEISVAHLCMTAGVIAGSICAGFALNFAFDRAFVIYVGFGLTFAATLFLGFFARRCGVFAAHDKGRKNFHGGSFKKALRDNPVRARATIVEMFHDVVTNTLWPVWMQIIGASGMAVGLLYAATVAMKFVLSPLVGRFVNARSGIDSQIGPAIKMIGWLPWLFIVHPLTSLWSSVFFAAGSHVFKIGLEARWYESRSYSHLAAREFYLGVGRIISLCVMVPVLFLASGYFIMAGAMMTALLLLCGSQLRRSLQMTAAE